MLEKNKDYIEMRVSSTDCAFTQNASTTISIEGFSYDTSFRLPDPGESYVIVSKEKFEKLQESVVYYMALSTRAQYWKDKCELAKQFEKNYNLLLEKTGFTSVVDLIDYICDPSMTSPEDKTLKEIIDEAEEDYISERDKAEALQKENEQLRNERTHIVYLNDPLGVIAKWERVTGYDSPEAFLKWKANIEGIMEAWKDATGCKYPGDARRLLEKWKTLTKCETPEAAATWITSYESACEQGNNLARKVEEWKEATGYPNPSSAKTAIESGASWCHAYNETKAANKKLVDDVESWRNVTGYSTPEGFLSAMLNDPDNTDTVLWKNATGCNSPGVAKCRIDALINEATDWEDKYNHLLELTGYKSEEAIHAILVLSDEKHQYQNMRDYINSLKRHSKFSEANWQNATGFKTPEAAKDYWVAKLSESGESNESLARKVRSWQEITGFSTPENCSSYIDTLEKKLEDIKDLIGED